MGDLHQDINYIIALILQIINRNPEPASRPSFMAVSCKLSQPDSILLQWIEKDVLVHKEAAVLGADLEVTVDLYKDLQNIYKTLSKS